MALSDICNYVQLSDQIATSGQPTVEQFAEIKAAGYGVVVNLAMPNSKNWLPDELTIVKAQGMTYQHIPVVWEDPTAENLSDLFATLEKNCDSQVWVHCALNMRVSAMMYLYNRLQRQQSDAEARPYMEQIWTPNETWQGFITAQLGEIG
ncbi:MAG: protein tyrosine phosphatase family protein [Cyanobacteria bacterium P01_G01_bin.38]